MDYTRWTELRQEHPQNPNSPSIDAYSHRLYTTSYLSYYSQHPQNSNPNPNPTARLLIDPYKVHEPLYSIGLGTGLRPPGIEQYPSFPRTHHGGHDVNGFNVAYAQRLTLDRGTVVLPSAYYRNTGANSAAHKWAESEMVTQYGVNSYALNLTVPQSGQEQLVPVYPHSTNAIVRPRRDGTWMRGSKKVKVVQSARCEICKVECTSQDDLEHHKLGKKHTRNLEKLKESIAPAQSVPAGSGEPVIGPQPNPEKGKAVCGRKKRRPPELTNDLETKKRKILEDGAAANAVRTCVICNVVCNSEIVFSHHLAGQKHAAMMKKHAAAGT